MATFFKHLKKSSDPAVSVFHPHISMHFSSFGNSLNLQCDKYAYYWVTAKRSAANSKRKENIYYVVLCFLSISLIMQMIEIEEIIGAKKKDVKNISEADIRTLKSAYVVTR